MTINSDLLLEVADAIETYPKSFDMRTFWGQRSSTPGLVDDVDGDVTGTPAECGTVGCIAGWAAALGGYRGDANEIEDVAPSLLGFTDNQAHVVFHRWTGRRTNRIAADLRGIAKGDLEWSPDVNEWVDVR